MKADFLPDGTLVGEIYFDGYFVADGLRRLGFIRSPDWARVRSFEDGAVEVATLGSVRGRSRVRRLVFRLETLPHSEADPCGPAEVAACSCPDVVVVGEEEVHNVGRIREPVLGRVVVYAGGQVAITTWGWVRREAERRSLAVRLRRLYAEEISSAADRYRAYAEGVRRSIHERVPGVVDMNRLDWQCFEAAANRSFQLRRQRVQLLEVEGEGSS